MNGSGKCSEIYIKLSKLHKTSYLRMRSLHALIILAKPNARMGSDQAFVERSLVNPSTALCPGLPQL